MTGSPEYARRHRDKVRGGPARIPQPCPSRAAAARHRRNGETVCDGCAEVERAYQRERQVVVKP